MKKKPLFLLFVLLTFAVSLPAEGQVSRLDKRFGINRSTTPAAQPAPKAVPKPAPKAVSKPSAKPTPKATPKPAASTDVPKKGGSVWSGIPDRLSVARMGKFYYMRHKDGSIPTFNEALEDLSKWNIEDLDSSGEYPIVTWCTRHDVANKAGYRYKLTDELADTLIVASSKSVIMTRRDLLDSSNVNAIRIREYAFWNPDTYEYICSLLSKGFLLDGWWKDLPLQGEKLEEMDVSVLRQVGQPFLYNTVALGRLPWLKGIEDDFNIYPVIDVTKIDYQHLSGRVLGTLAPPAKEFEVDDIPGLPLGLDWRAVPIPHSNCYWITPGSKGHPYKSTRMDGWNRDASFAEIQQFCRQTGLYLYAPDQKVLLPCDSLLGRASVNLTGEAMKIPFIWRTASGKIVGKVRHNFKNYCGWGPSMVLESPDEQDIGYIVQAPRHPSTEERATEERDAYILESEFDSSIGSSLCVWEPLPGRPGKSYWLAAGDNVCDLYLMDDANHRGKLMQRWRGMWGREVGGGNYETLRVAQLPAWLPERKWLFLPVMPHCWDVYELDEQTVQATRKFQLFTGNDGSYALVLPDGRYAGTPGCEKMLVRYENKEKRSMEPLAPWLNRPGEVLEAIGGDPDDVSALKATTRRWLQKRGYDPDAMPPLPQVRELPHVELDTGHVRYETAWGSRVAKLPLRVMAAGRPVEQLDVRVNGAPLPSRQMKLSPKGEDRVELSVPLTDGHCRIEVVAVDQEGYRSETAAMVVPAAASPWPVTYLVAIGVSDYEDESLHLKYAAKDAKDIAAAFQKYGAGKTATLVLTDGEVRDATALEKVREFLGQAWPEDRVILYVAGHGMLDEKLDYYYAPAGFDREDPAGSGISLDSLKDCLKGTRALNRLLLLDTCHSGFLGEAGEEKLAASGVQLPQGVRAIQQRGMQVKQVPAAAMNTAGKTRYVEELFAMDSAEDGINVIAASAGAEYALESDEWANGVLTASIMEALSGMVTTEANADGWISLEELQARVVCSVSERTGGLQRPSVVLTEGAGRMKLAPTLDSFIRQKEWNKVRELLDKGMKIEEARYFTSYSLVSEALYYHAPVDVVIGLLEAGATARPMPASNAGNEFLSEVLQYSDGGYGLLLRRYFPVTGNNEERYNEEDTLRIIEALLKYGADPNPWPVDETETGWIETSNPACKKLLSEYGCLSQDDVEDNSSNEGGEDSSLEDMIERTLKESIAAKLERKEESQRGTPAASPTVPSPHCHGNNSSECRPSASPVPERP